VLRIARTVLWPLVSVRLLAAGTAAISAVSPPTDGQAAASAASSAVIASFEANAEHPHIALEGAKIGDQLTPHAGADSIETVVLDRGYLVGEN
jgi:hypothetical protein